MNLSELTTLRVGGPAGRLLEARTRDELVDAALAAWSDDDALILGGGSNLVVADAGLPGTVVRVMTRGVERLPEVPGLGAVRLRVEAGEPWDAVVDHAVANGWQGVEALSGIPGTAGAAPMQNIGAYGQEVGPRIAAIDFLDRETGEVVRLSGQDLGFGYRTSALKRGRAGVVLAIELGLTDDGGRSEPIRYQQLASALGVRLGDRAPVAEVRAAVLELRRSKGMVVDPADPDSVSAGSFFTNPIVGEHFARGLPPDAPRWPTEPERAPQVLPLGSPILPPAPREHQVKLSAAWLIERAGIGRGFSIPGSAAAISRKHTLAIVNRGGASARDIEQLAGFVQTRVLAEFGVALQPEPVLVGFDREGSA